MKSLPIVQIAEYEYSLDEQRIAKFPLTQRDKSKLLVYNNGEISHTTFRELSKIIQSDSIMVFNNTKVVQARLKFTKSTGALIEVFLIEPITPSEYSLSFSSTKRCTWKCIVGNLKRWKEEVLEIQLSKPDLILKAKKSGSLNDGVLVDFLWDSMELSFANVIELCGNVPIPPYLNRKPVKSDKSDYQTIYAKPEGSVAAPTAGLHFTPEVLKEISAKGIMTKHITLHVGAGTFKPVKTDTILEHEMHTEHFFVNREILTSIRETQGKIVSVGTTTLRTLESIYWLGVKQHLGLLDTKNPFVGQWEAYQHDNCITLTESFNAIEKWLKSQKIELLKATTQLCIVPGYRFRVVDTLITNYHQPRSTLLLLVAAFIGEDWKRVYGYALDNGFRFLSYGDSSILFR